MPIKYASEITDFKKQGKNLRNKLVQRLTHIGNSVDDATKLVAIRIFERSQELVPVDKGLLKTSAFIKRIKRGTASGGVAQGIGKNPAYTVGYNAASLSGEFIIAPKNNRAFYAIYVHEGLRPVGVAKHKPPTGAKYLERAVNEERGKFKGLVVQEIKKREFSRR